MTIGNIMQHTRLAVGILVALAAFADSGAAADIDVFEAAREGDVRAIRSYVAAGGNVGAVNDSGYTPFILAAYYARIPAMEALTSAGADPCALDGKGSNAFMGVAYRGHLDAARWLVEHTKCNVNHSNRAGQTALMMASLFGRDEIVAFLLEKGADPSVVDLDGNTAESLADGQGLAGVVTKLRFALR